MLSTHALVFGYSSGLVILLCFKSSAKWKTVFTAFISGISNACSLVSSVLYLTHPLSTNVMKSE
jgi:hypothetical protein